MPRPRTYIPGEYKISCDVCGWVWNYSQVRKGVSGNQRGLVVCPDCFDPVHPRDRYKVRNRVEGKLPKVR